MPTNETDIEFQAKTVETIVEAFPMTALYLGQPSAGARVHLCLSFVSS